MAKAPRAFWSWSDGFFVFFLLSHAIVSGNAQTVAAPSPPAPSVASTSTVSAPASTAARPVSPSGDSSITSKMETSTSPPPSSSVEPQTHTIQVGNADHKFKPDVVQAEVGDTVEFHFYPQNHSVVRAEYEYPCIPYEMTGVGKRGFFSGFNPVDAILSSPPKYSLLINETQPIFFYCSAPGSCITWGMVGVINPNSTTSLQNHRQIAQDSSFMLQPGEPFPAESPLPSPSSSSTPTPSPQGRSSSSSSSSLSPGAIAGIVLGTLALLALSAFLFSSWNRLLSLKADMHRKSSTIAPHAPRSPTVPGGLFGSGDGGGGGGGGAETLLQMRDSDAVPPVYYPSVPVHGHGPAFPQPRLYARSPPLPPCPLPHAYTTDTYCSLSAASPPPPPGAGAGAGAGLLDRRASVRSVGGTFDVSPATGYYVRTHDGLHHHQQQQHQQQQQEYDAKMMGVSGGVVGYGRQGVLDRRAGESISVHSERPAPGYYETMSGLPEPYHVNERQGPAEMDGNVSPKRI